MKRYLTKFCYTALVATIITAFCMHPEKYMGCFFDGLTVWAHNILPTLFPFALLMTIYTSSDNFPKISLCKRLFKVDCDSVFLSGILCGYPVGAKVIAESNCNRSTALKMASFCMVPSPVFLIATVGANMLRDGKATLILLVSQLIALLLNGLTYRNTTNDAPLVSFDTKSNFGETVTNCVLSVLSVGGLVALCFLLTAMLQSLLPNAIANHPAIFFLVGLLEMTSGSMGICGVCDLKSATILTSTLLSFGGLCVFLQSFAFLSQKGVKPIELLKVKSTQSAYATLISFVLTALFL